MGLHDLHNIRLHYQWSTNFESRLLREYGRCEWKNKTLGVSLYDILLSFYWASVANASNVLQPYWLIVLPLDVPVLTASFLL